MRREHVIGNTEVIVTSTALIPAYHLPDRELVLFDSGPQPNPKFLKELEEENLRVRAVLCTHLHPDHIANNQELVQGHGAEIYIGAAELNATSEMLLRLNEAGESSQAKQLDLSYSICLIENQTEVDIAGRKFPVLPTPGHTAGHLAFATPDGVCFFGDAMMSERELRYAKLPYMIDVDQSIASMELIRQTQYPYYVAAHKEVISRDVLDALVDSNVKKELDLYEVLRQRITGPMELAVNDFMHAIGIENTFIVEHWLMRQTASARIEALVKAGELRLENGFVMPA